MEDILSQFKKPRVCEDGHDKLIYDADFFGGPGEQSCPICEKLKEMQVLKHKVGEKESLIVQIKHELWASELREMPDGLHNDLNLWWKAIDRIISKIEQKKGRKLKSVLRIFGVELAVLRKIRESVSFYNER